MVAWKVRHALNVRQFHGVPGVSETPNGRQNSSSTSSRYGGIAANEGGQSSSKRHREGWPERERLWSSEILGQPEPGNLQP
jgi:hypothetical protein